MPLHMRLPKRGFNNIFGKDFAIVNLGEVQKLVDAKKLDPKATVDHAALKAAGVARGGKDGVRLLGKGELKAKAKFVVAGVSAGAKAAVEAATAACAKGRGVWGTKVIARPSEGIDKLIYNNQTVGYIPPEEPKAEEPKAETVIIEEKEETAEENTEE